MIHYSLPVTREHYYILLENSKEMFPQYYMHSDMFSMFKYLTA